MGRLLGYSLFFLMLAFPMALSLLYVKAAMFVILLIILLCRAITVRSFNLHYNVSIGTVVLASVSLFFCLEGYLRATPGAGQCAQVYVLWPLVYLLVVTGINEDVIVADLENVAVLSTAFIGVFGILYFLSSIKIIPQIPFAETLLPNEELSSGFYSGHVELAFPGINSLPFLVPYVFSLAVIRKKPRFLTWTALLLSLPVVILSGRRALQIVTMLSPILTYSVLVLQNPPERREITRRIIRAVSVVVLLVGVSISVLGNFSDVSLTGLKERLSAGFEFSDSANTSASARAEQYRVLTRDIMERPLLGAGFGATDFNSVRSEAMPWAYELYYVALLYQTGLVGFTLYSIGMLWLYNTSFKAIRGGYGRTLIPALIGMTALLIATATNPYLVRFDGLWAIFYPLALLNRWLLQNDIVVAEQLSSIQSSFCSDRT